MRQVLLLLFTSLLTTNTTKAFGTSRKSAIFVSSKKIGMGRAQNKFMTATNDSDTNNKEKLTVPSLPKWDPTNWTPVRFWNKTSFRAAAIVASIGLAASTTGFAQIPSRVAASLHLMSYGLWFGSMMYTTFILGITMIKNLPRQTFGKLQSKLFPKYFLVSTICVILQIVTLKQLPSLVGNTKMLTGLYVGLGSTLFNQFILEPKSTKVMFNRYELEDAGKKESDEYKQLAKDFGKFHGISSMVNLVTICASVGHGIYLAAALL